MGRNSRNEGRGRGAGGQRRADASTSVAEAVLVRAVLQLGAELSFLSGSETHGAVGGVAAAGRVRASRQLSAVGEAEGLWGTDGGQDVGVDLCSRGKVWYMILAMETRAEWLSSRFRTFYLII